jgi:hypothetical protein
VDRGRPRGRPSSPGAAIGRLEVSDREDPFAAIIRCTADPARADKRTRSKWSRVTRYAAAYKRDSEPLDAFIRRKGGINECAARFTKRLGRGGQRGRRESRRSEHRCRSILIVFMRFRLRLVQCAELVKKTTLLIKLAGTRPTRLSHPCFARYLRTEAAQSRSASDYRVEISDTACLRRARSRAQCV